jgi:hypothetical protein
VVNNAVNAQHEDGIMKEYKVTFPGFKFIDYIVIHAESADEAIVKAQAEVDNWSWVVQYGRGGKLEVRLYTEPDRRNGVVGGSGYVDAGGNLRLYAP